MDPKPGGSRSIKNKEVTNESGLSSILAQERQTKGHYGSRQEDNQQMHHLHINREMWKEEGFKKRRLDFDLDGTSSSSQLTWVDLLFNNVVRTGKSKPVDRGCYLDLKREAGLQRLFSGSEFIWSFFFH